MIFFFTAAINLTLESVTDSTIDARIVLVMPNPVGFFQVFINGGGHSDECRLSDNIPIPVCVFKGLLSATKFTLSGQPCTKDPIEDACGYTATATAWTLPIRKNDQIQTPTHLFFSKTNRLKPYDAHLGLMLYITTDVCYLR